jgi:3-hydroxybutyryl-CoA dehydratase
MGGDVSASPTSPSESLFAKAFDDLELGERFATAPRVVSDEDVLAFAELSGDHHPLHVDEAWAAEGPFGRRIAHGMLVLSRAAGEVPFDPRRVRALRRVRDAVFKRPVFPGETIHTEGRIDELKPVDDGAGLVACALDVRNGDGKLVARATLELVWAREP